MCNRAGPLMARPDASDARRTPSLCAPDVATWYAANRMRPYVEAGLFKDVSDLWMEPEIADNLASTKSAMTIF